MDTPEIKTLVGPLADVCAQANEVLGKKMFSPASFKYIASLDGGTYYMCLSFAVLNKQVVSNCLFIPSFVGRLEVNKVNTETSERTRKAVQKELKKLMRSKKFV